VQAIANKSPFGEQAMSITQRTPEVYGSEIKRTLPAELSATAAAG